MKNMNGNKNERSEAFLRKPEDKALKTVELSDDDLEKVSGGWGEDGDFGERASLDMFNHRFDEDGNWIS